MIPSTCAQLYNTAFPERPPLTANADWLVGTWAIGACYRNPNKLYGAYPYGYLERVHCMFPKARRILHAFSGGLTKEDAERVRVCNLPQHRRRGHAMELVDVHGPDEGRFPTWQGDVLEMPGEWFGRFDLILADPPYTPEDAEKYNTPMVNRAKVMQALHRVAQPEATLVWLDQVWPMHRKDQWKTWGHIGLVRSTNHRMRLVSFFEAQ